MVLLIHDASDLGVEASRVLAALPKACTLSIEDGTPPLTPGVAVVLAVDLDRNETLRLAIRHLRARQPDNPLVVVTRSNEWADRSRASLLGAERTVPVQRVETLLAEPAVLARFFRVPFSAANPALRDAVIRAAGTLSRAMTDGGLTSSHDSVQGAAVAVIEAVSSIGLGPWTALVEDLQDDVLRHVMHVMGLAVSFGLAAELPDPWLRKMSAASLMHDVGKGRIPRAILDKEGPLTREERLEMSAHPKLGADMLRSAGETDGDVLDAVLHHHELMDGSGYPHRLGGGQIRPLTRMLTIADIFAALVEQRSYKPAMTASAAYEQLKRMGPKLDQGFVATFRKVALD